MRKKAVVVLVLACLGAYLLFVLERPEPARSVAVKTAVQEPARTVRSQPPVRVKPLVGDKAADKPNEHILAEVQTREAEHRALFEERISPEMEKEIAALRNGSDQPLIKETTADGIVTIDLDKRYHSVPVAIIDDDGNLRIDYHGESYVQ